MYMFHGLSIRALNVGSHYYLPQMMACFFILLLFNVVASFMGLIGAVGDVDPLFCN